MNSRSRAQRSAEGCLTLEQKLGDDTRVSAIHPSGPHLYSVGYSAETHPQVVPRCGASAIDGDGFMIKHWTNMRIPMAILLATFAASCSAAVAYADIGYVSEEATISPGGKRFLVVEGATHHSCAITSHATQARFSSDRSAILVSAGAYVPRSSLARCGNQALDPIDAPAEIGALADVSIPGNVYVGMVLVDVQPASYLAVVAHLGSTTNLVSLPGAYIDTLRISALRENAFFYDEEAGPFPLISRDGRYVAVDGNPDCSAQAKLGVWDIHENKKVVLNGERSAVEAECSGLFESGPGDQGSR